MPGCRDPLSNKRRTAWDDVRRKGERSLRAGRIFHETGARQGYQDWAHARAELSHALRVWAAYRDWTAHRNRREQ